MKITKILKRGLKVYGKFSTIEVVRVLNCIPAPVIDFTVKDRSGVFDFTFHNMQAALNFINWHVARNQPDRVKNK